MDFNSGAYVGFWINWSRGPVLGATLTLPNKSGTVLVSAITILIQVSGTFSWMALCYLLHQWRIKQGRNDQYSDQQQIILRNVGSDFGVLWQIPRIRQSSKGLTPQARRSAIFLPTLAAVHLVLFIAAGIFSSQVTSAGAETLIKSSYCGYILSQSDPSANTAQDYENASVDDSRNADVSLHQVQICNVKSSSVASGCDVFASRIDLDKQYNATCPFHDTEMCSTPDGLALKLDTGLLDSQLHFGINSPQKNRVQFRQVVTCSPVKQDGFRRDNVDATAIQAFSTANGTYLPPGIKFSLYDYGPYNGRNYSYHVNDLFNYTQYGGYYMATQTSSRVSGNFTWHPVSNLTTKDSDLTVLFSQYVGNYLGVVNDPLFAAHARGPKQLLMDTSDIFFADYPASVLGCAYQYQVCNNNTSPPSCTSLMRSDDWTGAINDEPFVNGNKGILDLNLVQFVTTKRIVNSFEATTMEKMANALFGRLLLANNMRSGIHSMALPDNQWQLEVINIHNVMMTAIQRKIIEYATGPPADLRESLDRPTGDIGLSQCRNQIIRRDDYMNFSVFTVTIIAVVGTIFLTAYLCLEPLKRRYQERSELGKLRNLRWEKDELLELHRTSCQVQDRLQFSKENSSSRQSTVVSEALDLPIPTEYEDSGKYVYSSKAKARPFVVTTFI